MQDLTERGWVRAGMAMLVAGVLGGGVLAVASGTGEPPKVTADGVAAAATSLDPAGPSPADVPTGAPDLGDRVLMGDDGGSVTVSEVEDDVNAGRLFGAGEGFKYIAAEVKGCSGPNEENITFEPDYFLLRLDDGTIRDPGPGAKKPSLEGGTIPSGKCLSGWVTFTVPEGALPTGVIYDGSVRTTWTVPLPEGAAPTTTTTLKSAATTSTTAGKASTTTSTARKASASTTTTKPKRARSEGSTTTSTAKRDRTTASTGKSGRTTASTGKGGSTTGSTGKDRVTTTSTTRSGATTGSTSKPASSTSTTGKPASTTSTTGTSSTPTTAGGTKAPAEDEP